MDGRRMSRAGEWQVKCSTFSNTGMVTPEELMAVVSPEEMMAAPGSPVQAELGDAGPSTIAPIYCT